MLSIQRSVKNLYSRHSQEHIEGDELNACKGLEHAGHTRTKPGQHAFRTPKTTRTSSRWPARTAEKLGHLFSSLTTNIASNASDKPTNHAEDPSAEESPTPVASGYRRNRLDVNTQPDTVAFRYWATSCLHYEDQVPDLFCALDCFQFPDFYHLVNKAPSAPELHAFVLPADDNREILVVDHARDPVCKGKCNACMSHHASRQSVSVEGLVFFSLSHLWKAFS